MLTTLMHKLFIINFGYEFLENMNSKCQKNCNGKGECVNGICKCFQGYTGIDCSTSACPILCNGNGFYDMGKCRCNNGWHGDECELPIHQCQSPGCGLNGKCVNGIWYNAGRSPEFLIIIYYFFIYISCNGIMSLK